MAQDQDIQDRRARAAVFVEVSLIERGHLPTESEMAALGCDLDLRQLLCILMDIGWVRRVAPGRYEVTAQERARIAPISRAMRHDLARREPRAARPLFAPEPKLRPMN